MEIFLSQFHFLRPFAFFLILLLVFSIHLFKKDQNKGGSWATLCSPELLDYLQVGEATKVNSSSVWVLGLAGLLAITALAGPVWQKQPQAIYREASALVVALDLSRSMDAADIKPSRLVRAKQKLRDVLSLRKDGQTALIAFAGTAYVVTPLTDDTDTILSQLDGLTTDIMPKQGGMLDAAMQKAMALLQQASIKHGELLYLTDSDDASDAMLKKFTAAGHRVNVISVGTEEGAPIGKSDGGFLTDGHGNIAIAKLNVARLQHVASLGGGVYHALSLDNTDISPILARLNPSLMDQVNDTASKETSTQYDVWHEQGAWLLLLVIPLALLGFRRGLLVVVLCFSLQVKPVEASSWGDMWHTKNHQAEVLMQQKTYKKAAETFENPEWRMAAHYRDKNYQAVVNDFEKVSHPSSDDWYNKGNALAQLGKLDAAIVAYDAALNENPKHKDAQANKILLENMKKEQNKTSNKQPSNEKQSKKQTPNEKKKQQDLNKNKQGNKQNKQNDSKLGKDIPKQGMPTQKNKDDRSKAQQSRKQSLDKAQPDQPSKSEKSKPAQGKKNAGKDVEKAKQHGQQVKEESQQNKRTEEEMKNIEAQQVFEQNLRRIPDDPGGLLRRKFLYQYQQQGGGSSAQDGKAW